MSEYVVLLADQVVDVLDVADEKTERICTEKLSYLAEHPFPGKGRGDREKLPIDGQRDRYRLLISRSWTAFYTVMEEEREVRVLEIVSIDGAHKRYGF